jgi:hypothetical protein
MGFFEDLWDQIAEFFTSLLDTIRAFLEDLFGGGDE